MKKKNPKRGNKKLGNSNENSHKYHYFPITFLALGEREIVGNIHS